MSVFLNVRHAAILKLIQSFLEQSLEEVYDGQLFTLMDSTQRLIYKVGEVSAMTDIFLCFRNISLFLLSAIQHRGKRYQVLLDNFGSEQPVEHLQCLVVEVGALIQKAVQADRQTLQHEALRLVYRH